ncbi:MAG: hypothetical protein WC410_00340 [Candidatus Paceibacterota bacterium]|jgi:hypothetical protein|nr:hypothetical protein [Candidatus Paceibacterota bacterium]
MKKKETLGDLVEDIFFIVGGLIALAIIVLAIGVEMLQEKKKPAR